MNFTFSVRESAMHKTNIYLHGLIPIDKMDLDFGKIWCIERVYFKLTFYTFSAF